MRLRRFLPAVLVFSSLNCIEVRAQSEFFEKLLDDRFPSSSAQTEFTANSFRIKGGKELPSGSSLMWIPESTQWSRIEDRIVLPRTTIRVSVAECEGASAEVWGRVTPLSRVDRNCVGDILVPLVSGIASQFELSWRRNGKESRQSISIERELDAEDRIKLDSSCSSSELRLRRISQSSVNPRGAWVFMDCRWTRESSESGSIPTLDLWFHWDGEDTGLKLNGAWVRSNDPSVYHWRLAEGAPPLRIETKSGELYELEYRLPKAMRLGYLGAGIGPYHYRLTGFDTDVSTVSPVLTLYGSYQLGETVRLTAFSATTLNRRFFSDTGLYVKTDSFRFFDQRISVYLMFGANLYGFGFPSGKRFKAGAPQGFEAVVRDFLAVNRSLTAGAFIYPPIDGKSYYNIWLRYGSPRFFGELNYISLRDRFEGEAVYSRSVGISVGFPLAQIF